MLSLLAWNGLFDGMLLGTLAPIILLVWMQLVNYDVDAMYKYIKFVGNCVCINLLTFVDDSKCYSVDEMSRCY